MRKDKFIAIVSIYRSLQLSTKEEFSIKVETKAKERYSFGHDKGSFVLEIE